MQVVGVDFGTTNVRISTWDSEQAQPPEPKLIGAGAITDYAGDCCFAAACGR